MTSNSIQITTPTGNGCASRAFGGFVCLIFLAMGVAFVVLIVRDSVKELKTRSWMQASCVIVQSEVVRKPGEDSSPYRPVVRFRYAGPGDVAGASPRVSDKVRLTEPRYDDYRDAQRVVDRYPLGSAAKCFVDATDPNRAVLEHRSVWMLAMLPLPLLFVLIGGGGIVALIWDKRWKKSTEKPMSSQPTSMKSAGAFVLFGIFFFVGTMILLFVFVRPLMQLLRAQNWPATSCTIVSTGVLDKSDSESTSYAADILYRYSVNGREYRSNRVSLGPFNSGSRASVGKLIQKYPRGATRTCYVDPNDPTIATLERGFTWVWLFGLIPLVFMLVGGGGLIATARRRSEASMTAPARLTESRFSTSAVGRPRVGMTTTLKVKHSPLAKLIGATAVMLFWNGIVSIFVWQVISGYLRGRPDGCLTAFMIPFVLVGLFLIGAVVHTALAVFNPRVVLTLASDVLRPGTTTDLKWTFDGRFDRIHTLKIRLVGREEATYTRGTDRVTDKHEFHRAELVSTMRRGEIGSGSAKLVIPPDTMHSFAAKSNKIVWEIAVEGAISGWPDVKEEFEIEIQPAQASRAGVSA